MPGFRGLPGRIAALDIALPQSPPLQETTNAPSDNPGQGGEFHARRRPRPAKPDGSRSAVDIHPIGKQHVSRAFKVTEVNENQHKGQGFAGAYSKCTISISHGACQATAGARRIQPGLSSGRINNCWCSANSRRTCGDKS